MLQRAASNACSWWWASHIRTKQSRWLDTNLEEMEDRVKSMIKIVEEDGDSFAKKAEMYFKKRPELVQIVEETYRAYRALAERYDHISGELHKANHTLATAFPDQIQFDMQDEEDDILPKAITSIDASKLRKPSAEIPHIGLMNKRKENQPTLKKSRLARTTSRGSKGKAQEEIDRLQKGILVLQTEKEFIKSSYENGISKYWEIEKQITEMQDEVFSLQDEFSAAVVIEDNEARTLMAVSALKSCEDTMTNLQEQQKGSMEKASIQSERIKNAKEKLKACKVESGESQESMEFSDDDKKISSTTVNLKEEVSSPKQESLESQSIYDKVKEHIEISSNTSVVELAEKINELVTKVINFEATASSQTARLKSLTLEADLLHKHIQSFEEEKKTLINDSNNLHDRLKQAEEKLQRMQGLEGSSTDFSHGKTSEKVMSSNQQDGANIASRSLEDVTSLYAIEAAGHFKTKEVKETEGSVQNEKGVVNRSTTEVLSSVGDILEKAIPPKHQDKVNNAGLPQEMVTCLHNNEAPGDSKNKEVKEIPDTVNNLVKEESHGTGKPSHVLKVQEGIDHTEGGSQFKNDSIEVHGPKQETKMNSSSSADSNIHQSMDRGTQTGEQEISLDWLQSLVDGIEGKEKVLLAEYTSILRNYKDAKKRLSEVEKKNEEYTSETTAQIRELKSANTVKDKEIQLLRQNITSLQSNSNENAASCLQNVKKSSQLENDTPSETADEYEDINLPGTDGQHPPSAVEEKFRRDIDTLLEENLEFWLRFSTSYHNIQKFQTAFEDLQGEIAKLKRSKPEEGSSHSKKTTDPRSLPIDKQLRELKTELQVWVEQNVMLQGELQSRLSSLCSLQEEISGALETSLEGDRVQFAPYQAAKFQGELLNMQLENNKVSDDLQAGLDHVGELQSEVEKAVSRLHAKIGLPLPKPGNNHDLRHSTTKNRVPLQSFLFGAKPKKRQSILACVHPTLHKQVNAMTNKRPT